MSTLRDNGIFIEQPQSGRLKTPTTLGFGSGAYRVNRGKSQRFFKTLIIALMTFILTAIV
jgi:hypothetical protein